MNFSIETRLLFSHKNETKFVMRCLVEAVLVTVCCGSVLNRDLFYQDPVLFGSQHSVDSLIDDAALIIQVPRSQLHVVGYLHSFNGHHA